MIAYVLRKALFSVPILLGVNVLVFLLFFLVNTPDDMARQALGEKAAGPEQVRRWKESRGYHLPKFWNAAAPGVRKLTGTIFFTKSLGMFWGDFGATDMTLEPIGREIRVRLAPSLCLTVPIFLAGLLLDIAAALFLASRRGSAADVLGQFQCVALMSVSTLVYIIAGQFLFARLCHLVPVSGYDDGPGMVKFLLLPVFVGVLGDLGSGIRFYRTLFLEEMNKDHVRTARAKGLGRGRVLFTHVLKNAMIPILTNIPLRILLLMTGNLLLENFFGIPGLGGYVIDAIACQDFAVVRTMVFLGSVLYVAGTILADVCCAWVDPRIRLG